MTKTEYWKMKDSVFIKVSEDGIFKDTKSIPLDEVSKDILDKFEKSGSDYFSEDDGNLVKEAELETESNSKIEDVIESTKAEAERNSVILEKVEKEMASVSKEDIENFTSKVVATPEVSERFLPINDASGEKSIEHFVGELDPDHMGDMKAKGEDLISSGSFQDSVPSIDNYVVGITSGSDQSATVTKDTSGVSIVADKKDYDFVQAPSHYNGHTIVTKGEQEFEYETIEFIEAWLRRHAWMPEEAKYAAGNGLKYYDRVGNKPEDGKTREEKAAEDFEKISWYALRAAKALRGKLYKKD